MKYKTLLFSILITVLGFSQNNESIIFIEFLKTEKYNDAHNLFDEKLKSNISESKLKEIWSSVSNSLGALKSYNYNCSKTIEENYIEFTTCQFEKQTLDLKLVYNSTKEILGFFIVPVTKCEDKKGYNAPKYADTTLFIEKKITIQSDTFSL